LIRDETERRTDIGVEIHQLVSTGQIISNDLYVRMLKNIIFSGETSVNKFLMTGFPHDDNAVAEFESNCSKITAIIFAAGPEPVIEIQNNNLNSFNIDSLFSKQYRLKIMKHWNSMEFQEQLGNRTEWGLVSGRTLSGKSTVAKMFADLTRGKILNMSLIAEECKKKLSTEDEPFEGEVPLEEVEKETIAIVQKDK
jgi:hypothetical protein